MGQVLVLEYHRIGEPEERWQRTPANFKQDMEYLYANGYFPTNIVDLVQGFPDVPAGKKPVVLTFDDSYAGQFRYLEDGTIDPDSAVGMLLDIHHQYGANWPLKGTFYVLPDALFGQRDRAGQKLQWLVEQGFEVAGHTMTHFNLSQGSDDDVQRELAVSQRQLEAQLPAYKVQSLSVPYGAYPLNPNLVASGIWDGAPYTYSNVVMVGGGAGPSPHSADFDPYYIRRTQAIQTELDYWLGYFAEHPELYYVSAGPGE
jgi:peptidoglycan/xylan/chitin deacetylase (PgdA/CDA1 family)